MSVNIDTVNETRQLVERRDEVKGAVLDAVYQLGDLLSEITVATLTLAGLTKRIENEQKLATDYQAIRESEAIELDAIHENLIVQKKAESDLVDSVAAHAKEEAEWENHKGARESAEKARLDALFSDEHERLSDTIVARQAEEKLLATTKDERVKADADLAAAKASAATELAAIQAQVPAAQKAADDATASLADITAQVNAATANLKVLKVTVGTYEKDIEDAEATLKDLTGKQNDARGAADAANKELESVNAQIAARQAVYDTAEATVKNLDNRKRGLDAREAYIAAMFKKQGVPYQPYQDG